MATSLFGRHVNTTHVIGDTLQPVTHPLDLSDPGLPGSLSASLANADRIAALPFKDFVRDPLCAWIEAKLGVTEDETTGELARAQPRRLTGQHGLASKAAERTHGSETQAAADPGTLPAH